MKISNEDYKGLKSDTQTVCEQLGVNLAESDGGKTGLKTMYAVFHKVCADRAYDDEHPNFKTGAWKRILPFTGRPYCWLYDLGLNDSHIATALKNIKAELTRLTPCNS